MIEIIGMVAIMMMVNATLKTIWKYVLNVKFH